MNTAVPRRQPLTGTVISALCGILLAEFFELPTVLLWPAIALAACEKALHQSRHPESGWLAEADLMLSAASWDTTQARMAGFITQLLDPENVAGGAALLVAAE